MQPKILLLDEPTAALDPAVSSQVGDIISKLKQGNMTIVVATHDIEFAKKNGDKFVFISDGEIHECGNKYIFDNPQTEKLAKFLQPELLAQ